MVALIRRRLPASSLVEVTVASVVLVIVFTLGLGSLARLAVTGPQQLKLRGQQLVGRLGAEAIRQRKWQTRTWYQEGFELDQTVRTYPEAPYLVNLRITATAGGHEMARWQQLVYAPPPPSP